MWLAGFDHVLIGVEDGLKGLSSGGVPPKFVIIDDGWQSVGPDAEENKKANKSEPLLRLTGVEENDKFKKKENPTMGTKSIVDVAKVKYGLKYVYVWHAIIGYSGGIQPGLLSALFEALLSVQQEAFFVSPGKLSLYRAALVEIVAGLFDFKRKSRSSVPTPDDRKQRKTSKWLAHQDNFVIPDEDEPPSIEAKTPTPKRHVFMARDLKRPTMSDKVVLLAMVGMGILETTTTKLQ
ncbi:hypothetical protein IFM89_009441 [Coptis chinensis]|uniref:Galactinol--sucrose galactosyltransferase n=1 Tax=Coptis chinensis TaxID=261450 RepID=A0A835LZS4_9MAGN|nr:hypothetical protein IFM89_009441 [Coptis chinensis]